MSVESRTRAVGPDLLRALAILAVMLRHMPHSITPTLLAPVQTVAWAGVDLFFVLSGYLIGTQLLKSIRLGGSIDLGDFYVRRAFRILPAFATVLSVYFLFPGLREAAGIAPIWRFLTFTMNIGLDVAQTSAFSHAWSLCVEEHFYLLLPLILLLLGERANLTRTVCIAGAIIMGGAAIRFWLWKTHVASALNSGDVLGATYGYMTYVYYPSWGRLDGLLFGVLLAAGRLFLSTRPKPATPAVVGLAGVGLVGAALWLFSHRGPAYLDVPNIVLSAWGAVVGLPLLGLGFALILSALLDLEPLLARLRNPVTSVIANLAFSLYLTHKLVLHAVSPLLEGRISSGAAFLVCLAACFAVAGLLYLAVERPFLALRSRVQKKREPGKGGVFAPERA